MNILAQHWRFLTEVSLVVVGLFIATLWALGPGRDKAQVPTTKEVVREVVREEEKGGTAPRSPLSADAIFAQVSPAVVQVVIQDRQDRTISAGSGFLVSRTGLIATNYHVIEEAHTAHVVLADKTKLSVLGAAALDEEADIVIIKVAGEISAQALELAGIDLPPVGAKVYAIGNPLGLANTLSDGLVSGHREVRRITMIQTTAPISPGSSGGPLLRGDGKVVGVTTESRVYGNFAQNLNFAVPASHVARLLLGSDGEGQLIQFPLVRQLDAFAYIKRGNACWEKREYDKAIKEYDEAIRLDPNYAHAYSRGYIWSLKKDYDSAIRDFDEAIRLDPKYSYAYFCRGNAWSKKKDYDKAIRDYDEAIRFDPKDALAYINRADAWLEKKEYDKAMRDYDEAIRLDPKDVYAYSCLSNAYIKRGDAWLEKKEYDNAISDFNEAIRLDPKDAYAYYNVAWLLATCPDEKVRDGERAIQMGTKACELTAWKRGLELDALAAAYAEAGRFDEARRYEMKALDTPTGQGPVGNGFRRRLDFYKQNKPFRESN